MTESLGNKYKGNGMTQSASTYRLKTMHSKVARDTGNEKI